MYYVLSELPAGIASPRKHRARLGHGDGVVPARGDVADEVVLERGDGRRQFRLLPGVVPLSNEPEEPCCSDVNQKNTSKIEQD